MKSKLAKSVAVLTVVGFMAAGPMAYAESDGNNFGDNPGNNPGNNPGDNPGNNPGDNPGNNPGDNPGDNPGNAQGYQHGGGLGFMEELNLTQEQRERLKALQESDKAMTEQIKKKTQELDAVVAEPGTTRSDTDYLVDEISTLQAKVLSQKMDRFFVLKKILPPEQFEKMQEMEKQRMKKGPGGFGGQNPGPDQN